MSKFCACLGLLVLSVLVCRKTDSSEPGVTSHTLETENGERSYLLDVPPSYDGSSAVPLIVSLHGGGGNAENQMRVSGFNVLSSQEGFIVAYPNGSGRLDDKILTWNGGGCCGYAVENHVDDVAFVRTMITVIRADYNVDPRRIYATGLSNGAIMAYRLACEAADLFAAIAPVAGTMMDGDCQPVEPVSLIHFHGTNDTRLPYEGGIGSESVTGVIYQSVSDSLAFWILSNRCPSRAEQVQDGDVVHLSYSPCSQETAVELFKIIGGGHAWPGSSGPAWPGGDTPIQSISATKLMWEFFQAHLKP